MQKIYTKVTDKLDFFEGNDPFELARTYGTPLYVYNERILRTRCRELKNLVKYPNFVVDYSAKANSSLAFLQIVKSEGLEVDAMSPGEIYIEKMAGFEPHEIFYICNNVSDEEMMYAIQEKVIVSVDSLSQLEKYGKLAPDSNVAIRFNPGVGTGHHEKVVTAGKNTKFGVDPSLIPQVKDVLATYNLTLIGINQHIGSLFMDGTSFINSIKPLFEIARQFENLKFIDLGGGFGIPYKKEDDEPALDLVPLGTAMDEAFSQFSEEYGNPVTFRIEPGRYISAECSLLLGEVHTIKQNHETTYVGCDVGFNVLSRPILYDSYHGIEVYRKDETPAPSRQEKKPVTIVGNICESGDILAKGRVLPTIQEGDLLGILDAGAYGSVMSSNYNSRLRPAEVLIRENGEVVLIRERDTLEDLSRRMKPLP